MRTRAMAAAMLAALLLSACAARSRSAPEAPDPPEESVPALVMPSEWDEEFGPWPAEERSRIPFFVPDGADPSAMRQPDVPIPYAEADRPLPPASPVASDEGKFDSRPYFGRWIVQARGIDVACYLGWSQEIVDGDDAAGFFQMGDQYVIADHSNQAFSALASCRPGDVAVLETVDGKAFYVCAAVMPGRNMETVLADEDGTSIEYGFNPGGITCYTCGKDWRHLVLAVFYPAGA